MDFLSIILLEAKLMLFWGLSSFSQLLHRYLGLLAVIFCKELMSEVCILTTPNRWPLCGASHPPLLPLSRLCPTVLTWLVFLRTGRKRHDKRLCLAFIYLMHLGNYLLCEERRAFFYLFPPGNSHHLFMHSLLPLCGSLAGTVSFPSPGD